MRSVDSETFEPKPNGERDSPVIVIVEEADVIDNTAGNRCSKGHSGESNERQLPGSQASASL